MEISNIEGESSFGGQTAALNAQIEAVKDRYEPEIRKLQSEGDQLKNDAPNPEVVEAVINVDFEVTWKDQRIVFDFPSVRMKDQRIVLDLPEVRMDLQRIVFDLPAIRMVPKVVGRYPEVHWPNVVWRDIIIHVPEPYMQRNEIKLDLPSISMKRHEFIFGVPEVKMERVEWTIGLPQFKMINIKAATEKLKQRGKALNDRAQSIAAAMSLEINALIANFLKGAGGVAGALDSARGAFDSALNSVKSAIETLQQRGIDPIKVPTDGGNVNLRKTFEDLTGTRDAILPKLKQLASGVSPDKLGAQAALAT